MLNKDIGMPGLYKLNEQEFKMKTGCRWNCIPFALVHRIIQFKTGVATKLCTWYHDACHIFHCGLSSFSTSLKNAKWRNALSSKTLCGRKNSYYASNPVFHTPCAITWNMIYKKKGPYYHGSLYKDSSLSVIFCEFFIEQWLSEPQNARLLAFSGGNTIFCGFICSTSSFL